MFAWNSYMVFIWWIKGGGGYLYMVCWLEVVYRGVGITHDNQLCYKRTKACFSHHGQFSSLVYISANRMVLHYNCTTTKVAYLCSNKPNCAYKWNMFFFDLTFSWYATAWGAWGFIDPLCTAGDSSKKYRLWQVCYSIQTNTVMSGMSCVKCYDNIMYTKVEQLYAELSFTDRSISSHPMAHLACCYNIYHFTLCLSSQTTVYREVSQECLLFCGVPDALAARSVDLIVCNLCTAFGKQMPRHSTYCTNLMSTCVVLLQATPLPMVW